MSFFAALLNSLPGAVSQGLIWGVMALGVDLTFRIMNVSDLTVDGSLATGGAVCVVLIRAGINPWIAMAAACFSGAIAGLVTALLHTKCEIPAILAGILTQLALYSVNLRILGGRANLPVSVDKYHLVLSQRFVGELSLRNPLFILVLFCAVLILAVYWFFGTEKGCSMRATGNNPAMARAQGINTKANLVIGFMMSNAFVALAGALLAQFQGAADVNMGRGAIVIGLAAVIIGETIFKKIFKNFGLLLMGIVIGAVIYYIVLQVTLQLGLNTNDLKLISAAIVALFLSVPHISNKVKEKRHA